MKRFFVFLTVLMLLIISEYMLVSELFSQRRPAVLSATLISSLVCVYAAYRLFKKNVMPAKHSRHQG